LPLPGSRECAGSTRGSISAPQTSASGSVEIGADDPRPTAGSRFQFAPNVGVEIILCIGSDRYRRGLQVAVGMVAERLGVTARVRGSCAPGGTVERHCRKTAECSFRPAVRSLLKSGISYQIEVRSSAIREHLLIGNVWRLSQFRCRWQTGGFRQVLRRHHRAGKVDGIGIGERFPGT